MKQAGGACFCCKCGALVEVVSGDDACVGLTDKKWLKLLKLERVRGQDTKLGRLRTRIKKGIDFLKKLRLWINLMPECEVKNRVEAGLDEVIQLLEEVSVVMPSKSVVVVDHDEFARLMHDFHHSECALYSKNQVLILLKLFVESGDASKPINFDNLNNDLGKS